MSDQKTCIFLRSDLEPSVIVEHEFQDVVIRLSDTPTWPILTRDDGRLVAINPAAVDYVEPTASGDRDE